MRSTIYTKVVRQTGPATWLTFPWDGWLHPRLVRNALCPDGKRRTVYLGQEADSYFSWPGRVKIGGKWIKGFVTSEQGEDTVFTANAF